MDAFGDAMQLIKSGLAMVLVVLGNLLMEDSSKSQLELITDFGVSTLMIKFGLEKLILLVFGVSMLLIKSGPEKDSREPGKRLMEHSSKSMLALLVESGVLTLMIKSGLVMELTELGKTLMEL